jgi:two-component system, NarL family, nitrate/nitrite response regulator NarL
MAGTAGRIVLVDDHPSIADAVARALTLTLDLPVIALGPEALTTPEELIDRVVELEPDLVLLDVRLGPLGDAVELIPDLVARGQQVLCFTADEAEKTRARAVEAGAVGVLGKSLPLEDIESGVRACLEGEPLLRAAERDELLAHLRRTRAEDRQRQAPFAHLTHRERQVLDALAEGLTVEQVAARQVVSIHTVRAQVKAILRKLGVNSQLAAVAMVHRAYGPPR